MITVYSNCQIYGPYTRKEGRMHICAIHQNGIRKTVSYPKYLVEKHIGRYLTKEETVDHNDQDFRNNDLSNLIIRSRIEHAKLDAKRLKEQSICCQVCGNIFNISGMRLHRFFNKKLSIGPFCSRSCGGYASHYPEQYIRLDIPREYTTNKSLQKETSEVQVAKTENPLIGNPVLGKKPSVETLHDLPKARCKGKEKVQTTNIFKWW